MFLVLRILVNWCRFLGHRMGNEDARECQKQFVRFVFANLKGIEMIGFGTLFFWFWFTCERLIVFRCISYKMCPNAQFCLADVLLSTFMCNSLGNLNSQCRVICSCFKGNGGDLSHFCFLLCFLVPSKHWCLRRWWYWSVFYFRLNCSFF